jgi:hypothetical protein
MEHVLCAGHCWDLAMLGCTIPALKELECIHLLLLLEETEQALQ